MMSRLEELIAELCPDGVTFYPLCKVAHYAKKRIDASQVDETSYVGVENLLQNKQGKTIASAVPGNGVAIAFEEGDILIGNIRPYLRKIWLADCNGGTNGDVLTVQIDDKTSLLPKFLYYVLSSEDFFLYDIQNSKGAKMPRGSKEAVMNYQVPVPPLPVQSEIVHILDNFTELTVELTERLTAELTARKTQYKFYRDMLLTSSKHIEYKTLSDISHNCDRQRKPVTKGKRETGRYPYYGASGIVDYVADYIFDGDYLLISEDGANLLARTTPIAFSISGQNWVNNHAHVIQFDTLEMQKYVEIYLNSIDLSKYISGGAQPKLNQDNLNKIPIPVPLFNDEVKQIVTILTKFNSLCNNLTSGLSAEIEAQQQQYEYYRDKLLTFRELNT